MPRRRFRDPDPQVRDRNMLDILGAPGLSGLSRVGGLSGGSQTASLVVRGGREGGDGVQIEHVTLEAVASQTIADGGGTVQFDTTAGAPTEVRGFDTLLGDLASSGQVGDIPVDVTGVLKFIVDGRWASWRSTGTFTATLLRDGSAVGDPVSYDISGTREFGGDDDGFEVQSGDSMRYELSNDSGSGQELAELKLVQLVRVLAAATSTVAAPLTPPLDPEVWWRADALSGSTVDAWANEGSYGARWDLADSAHTGSLPALVADELNGLPVVRITNGEKALFTVGDSSDFPNSATSFYAVFQYRGGGGTFWRANTTNWGMGVSAGGSVHRHTSGTVQLDRTNVTGWFLDAIVRGSTSGDTNWWRDGGSVLTDASAGQSFGQLSLAYARTVSETAAVANIDVAEILIYAAEHTAAERAEVEAYLSDKWGV